MYSVFICAVTGRILWTKTTKYTTSTTGDTSTGETDAGYINKGGSDEGTTDTGDTDKRDTDTGETNTVNEVPVLVQKIQIQEIKNNIGDTTQEKDRRLLTWTLKVLFLELYYAPGGEVVGCLAPGQGGQGLVVHQPGQTARAVQRVLLQPAQ